MEIECCDRWIKSRLQTLLYENKDKNTDFAVSHALQFYFGEIIPKKEYALTDDLIATYKKYTVVRYGDIVINGLNLNYDFVTQRAGFVREAGIITSAYVVLRARENVNAKYYCYLFKALDAHKMLNGMGTGIRLTLSYRDLKNLQLPVPPKDEQDQIARFLDWKITAIDKLIAIRREELRNLAELKKALITREVTRGNWERVRLKRVARINPPCDSHGLKPEDIVTFAPMECIRTDRRIPKDAPLSNYNSSYTVFNDGDIAIAKVTPCFENDNICVMENLTNGYAFGSSELFNIRPFNIDTKFLLYYFMTHGFKSGGAAHMTGAIGLKRVPSKYLRNVLVPLPPITEQKRIANYLDRICAQIDSAITNFTQQIDTLKELKACLISDAVTGKIDVRNISVPEQENKS